MSQGAAAATTNQSAVVFVVSPTGEKESVKVRLADDVSTLRALITQMFDTGGDWTQQTDRREDRKEYSDWTDEDVGFSEVIALEPKPKEEEQRGRTGSEAVRWRNPRTWLEWSDKRGKLRLMCGVYHLADGKPLSYYDIGEGSVIHPLYERYGDALDAGAKMLSDPDWYRQQAQQAKQLASQASSYASTFEWRSLSESVAPYKHQAASYFSFAGTSWGGAAE
eukprot:CAMPEP_0177734598 /NCGR_PEP_ID=MMETSP0484_2-20121128/24322_1 /TAXON_ID=354590 /ORGANISM="Rhodomonas lens, Strain RHODO" /LENGTH=221 /DNA_ID=CAMNT_0019248093 /DNA_START=120 /DNA_END=782 /DNA_ORIENTATION=-